MPSAAFTTLGCKVNQYETQKILESFEEAGFEIVPFDAPADVYVINSCSVTSIAESKSRYTIRKAARTNPNAKVVVTGCAAQMARNKGEEIEGAHVSVPNPDKMRTLEYFLGSFPEFRAGSNPPNPTNPTTPTNPTNPPNPTNPANPTNPTNHTKPRTRATLKVQDGCSVYCSYCSIPHTRPGMVSRPYSELLEEAKTLVELGYREIILTGVLIGAYGPETGSGAPDFETMVERLQAESGIQRLRISSIEMRQVTPRLIELLKGGIVVPHLHIPLQSGDSGVLKDMNRPYTREDYITLCERLYKGVPDISITTDIMVGFPTETAERFEQTAALCKEVGFLKIHVFRFSPRYGTPADTWGDPVSNEQKVARSAELSMISNETGKRHAKRFLGRTMRVLVEGKVSKEGLLEGLTDNYLQVQFAGPLGMRGRSLLVQLREVNGIGFIGEMSERASLSLPRRGIGP